MASDLLDGRYRRLHELGRGGMGTVWKVEDTGRKNRILALKLLDGRRYHPSAVRHFEQEFLAHAELRHPGLVEVYDFGRLVPEGDDPATPYFTMEYVDGVPLDVFVRQSEDPPGESWFEWLAPLVEALRILHARGFVHRDLKPGNVLVGGERGSLVVKLMDLGLVERQGDAGDADDRVKGTAAYLAPEAIRGEPLDPRADLYALGCTLYELMTGRPPFREATLPELLRAHLEQAPLAPSMRLGELPEAWDGAVLSLLSKSPGERPARIESWWRALHEALGRTLPETPVEQRKHRILGGGFLGRAPLLARWDAAADGGADAGPAVWLILGGEGLGKSRLLRELRLRSQLAGSDLPIGSVDAPGGALREALGEALALGAGTGESEAERWVRDVETDPDLGPVLEASLIDRLEAKSRDGAFAWAVDDVDRLGEADRRLLSRILREAARRRWPMRFVGTIGDDARAPARSVWGAIEPEIFRLDAFTADEVRRWVHERCGGGALPELLLQRLVEESGGHPVHLETLLTWLVEEGRLVPGDEPAWKEPADAAWELPRRLRDLIDRRLERLESSAREVWDGIAVWGRARIDVDAVASTLARRADRVLASMLSLERAGWVRVSVPASGEPIYRVRQRGTLDRGAELLEPERRRDLHARALRTLERRGGERAPHFWCRMARHADAADMPGRTVDAWGRAGERALERGAPGEAREALSEAVERALRLPSTSVEALCHLYRLRSEAHRRLDATERAIEDARWWLARAEKASHRDLVSEARLTLARRLADAGREDEAAGHLHALADDGATPGALRDEAVETLALRERDPNRRLEAWTRRRASLDAKTDPETRQRIAYDAATTLAELGERALAESWIETVRDLGVPAAPATAAAAAALRLDDGDAEGARRILEAARDHARAAGDAPALRQADRALGWWGVNIGDPGRTAEAARGLGDDPATQVWRAVLARADAEPPDDAMRAVEAVDPLRLHDAGLESFEAALASGDLDTADAVVAAWPSDADERRVDLRIRRGEARARLQRRRGALEDALKTAQEAAFAAERHGSRVAALRTTLLLGELHLDAKDPERAGAAKRRAERTASAMPSPSPLDRAAVARLAARYELERPGGDLLGAEHSAAEAEEAAESAGRFDAVLEAVRLRARAERRLSRDEDADRRLREAAERTRRRLNRWPESTRAGAASVPARAAVLEAFETERESIAPRSAPAPSSGQLSDARARIRDLESLLELNRELVTARDVDALLDRVLDAAQRVVGSERAFVWFPAAEDEGEISRGRGADAAPLSGDDLEFPRSVARRVAERGTSILSAEADRDEALVEFRTLHQLRVVSLICAPIPVEDQPAGALYLDSRIGRRPFDAEHRALAEALAVQAGLAWSRARTLDALREERERTDRLNAELRRALEQQQQELADAREALTFSRTSLDLRMRFEGMVGASPAMQRVYHLVERLAPKSLPVLVTGESGTGKELIAHALHNRGARPSGPFFTVNCAAIHETLLESELFGYRKGAFTGADRDKPGYFELADGGTLFLDEVGEMGPAMQAKLLRTIERGEVFPVGARAPQMVDVRIVTATHRDLKAMIAEGSFREDLYYRFNVGRIDVPPLRERREDIPILVDHFLDLHAEQEHADKLEIDAAVLRRLARHPWPGNVRELQHQLLRIGTFCRDGRITVETLVRYGDLPDDSGPAAADVEGGPGAPFPTLEALEATHLRAALERSDGNRTRAAELLGINRATLFRKLKKLDSGS